MTDEHTETRRMHWISLVYGSGHTAVTALREANVVARGGELVAILGPSGSGKTTLLTSAAGIVEPTSGRVTIGGIAVYDNGWKVRDLGRFRREYLGFILQSHNLILFLTARENVLVALQTRGITGSRAVRIVKDGLVSNGQGRGSGPE